jgi:hypothetical protein
VIVWFYGTSVLSGETQPKLNEKLEQIVFSATDNTPLVPRRLSMIFMPMDRPAAV